MVWWLAATYGFTSALSFLGLHSGNIAPKAGVLVSDTKRWKNMGVGRVSQVYRPALELLVGTLRPGFVHLVENRFLEAS